MPDSGPRPRLKLWHLAGLVAVSALLFAVGRGLMSSDPEVVTRVLFLGGFLIFLAVLMTGLAFVVGFAWLFAFAVKWGDRVAESLEGWGDRRGGLASACSRAAAFVVYLSIVLVPFELVGGMILLLRALIL